MNIQPRAWTPPPVNPALQGSDVSLAGVERLHADVFAGADTLQPQGRYLYTGSSDGKLQEIEPETGTVKSLKVAPTRALGLIRSTRDTFVVADQAQGLSYVHKRGHTPLVSTYRQQALLAVRDLALSRDGWIYFSNTSSKHDAAHADDALLEHAGDGQVLRYYDLSGEVQPVLEDLDLPGGLAFGPDDQYLLIVEQGRYRVLKHWLAGTRAGQTEIFIDGLPGRPDGLSWNGRDTYWLTLRSARPTAYDAAAQHPGLRRFYARLPRWLRPQAAEPAWVLGLDHDGKVCHRLYDNDRQAYAPVTSAIEHHGYLYLGSDRARGIARLPLSRLTAKLGAAGS